MANLEAPNRRGWNNVFAAGLYTAAFGYAAQSISDFLEPYQNLFVADGTEHKDDSDPFESAGPDADPSWSNRNHAKPGEPQTVKTSFDHASEVPHYEPEYKSTYTGPDRGRTGESDIPNATRNEERDPPPSRDDKFAFLGEGPLIGVPYLDAYLMAYREIRLNVTEFVSVNGYLPDLALTRSYYRRQAFIIHRQKKGDKKLLQKLNVAQTLIESLLSVPVNSEGLPNAPSVFLHEGKHAVYVYISPAVLVWAMKNPGDAKLHYDKIVKAGGVGRAPEIQRRNNPFFLPLGLLLGVSGITYVFYKAKQA